jgi:hypothetical protein
MTQITNKWWSGPVLFFVLYFVLLLYWAIVEPAILVRNFDQGGYSPFELSTIPVFLAAIPLVWMRCPFAGSRFRKGTLCLAVTVVVIMAVVKELDLHNAFLHMMYPDCVEASGSMVSGKFFKPNGSPLTGTPFKMRVLTNAAVPLGLKGFIMMYFMLFFGIFAAGFAYLVPTFLKGVFSLRPAAWSFGCLCGAGLLVQVSDRLPSWLGHKGALAATKDGSVTAMRAFCTAIEEGGEMILALFVLYTIYQGWKSLSESKV